jgi:YjjG family noncanonical pyrimidine nucleotidase
LFRNKKHLFFDLDHTLWHYEANCRHALEILYQKHQLEQYNVPNAEVLYQKFYEVNTRLWQLYDTYQITPDNLRERRFLEIMNSFAPCDLAYCNMLSHEYLELSPRLPALIDGCQEILDYLAPKYQLHIITNGFAEIQETKMRVSGIKPYFGTVTCSAKAGYRKPESGIFSYALAQAGAHVQESLMIGDNPATDIAGAKNIGMDWLFFDPENIFFEINEKTRVKHLLDLKQFL